MSETELLRDERDHWLETAKYYKQKLARAERALEIVARERDAYKAYIDRIVQLKTDALLTQPFPSIIVERP